MFYSKFSNSQFVLSGEFRPRFEFRDGHKQLMNEDENPTLIMTQRSRLNFGYNNQKISTKLSLQDVRIWGETSSKEDVPGVHVIEAWTELLFNQYLSLKLGRQV